MRSGLLAGALGAALLLLPSTAAAAPPTPFGHACAPENGVLFCPTESLGDRVPSFDGAPLDVDVTLPSGTEAGDPLPTIVMMHGFGGSKSDFEADSPDGGNPDSDTLYRWNNNYFARQGYAVVNYTARGFGRSCGRAETSNATPECLNTKSYLHLADQRWEVRDTQYLLGLLTDQAVTIGDQVGVTGISYGGGQSIQLAYLRNRIRNEDGSFSAWRSPNGTPMEIRAAYPRWPWSDLADALLPNGRFRDTGVASQTESLNPTGIPILSYISGLFALGSATGTYCGAPPRVPPVCTDPTADLTKNYAEALKGEPVSAGAQAFLQELHDFHSGYGLADEAALPTPAPLLLQSGWTDDLFPPEQSIRVYNQLREVAPSFPVAMQFGDLGHARGSNKKRSDRAFNDQAAAFFDENVEGLAGEGAPKPGRVTAYTQTCPQDAPTNGPFTGRSYERLAGGSLAFSEGSQQTINSNGGNPATGVAIDPIAGGGDACTQVPEEEAPGTAILRGPVSRGYTVLGLPTVTARVDTQGNFGQLDSRLWDVSPDGQQTLITRGAYRLRDDQQGRVAFEMNGNGYCLEAGHRPKLELLGRDNPRLRPSNSNFTVDISNVEIDVPTAERDPKPKLKLTAKPGKAKSGKRTNFRFEVTSREQRCATSSADKVGGGKAVKGAEVDFGGKTVTTGADGKGSVKASLQGTGKRTATATLAGFRSGQDRVQLVAQDGGGGGDGSGDDGDGDGSGGGSGTDSDSTGSGDTVTADGAATGGLPFTGLELIGLVLAGLGLLGTGWALQRRVRRRSADLA